MRTPDGRECRFYYQDFHRGRNRQECRLIDRVSGARAWRPSDCYRCPVPDILRANASEYLELHAEVRPGMLGIGRRVDVMAWCDKHDRQIEDPYIGCRECAAERPGFSLLLGDEGDK